MTKLKYLENTYLFEYESKIVDTGENDFGKYIILDETIFYPQGGGQACDIGEIIVGNVILKINNVRLIDGIVYHYVENLDLLSKNLKGKQIKLIINKERRILNARNHSAGHLIDIAIKNIGLDYLIPKKGHHFQGECYLEYSGNIENLEIAKNKLQENINRLISENIKINSQENDDILNGKKYRFVYFEGYKNFGCGCGGTHISKTKEIGKIEIIKIKESKNIVKVSYKVI